MNIDTTAIAPLSLPVLILNMGMGLALSLLVAWFYVRYGNSLSNRSQFAPILPILTLITLLTISIVKSSLALSLGLVGALSIVRFRTAIKDPEELIFLFFAIAIGLGLGADQRIPTLAAVVFIMLYLGVRTLLKSKSRNSHSLYLNVLVDDGDDRSGRFNDINNILLKEFKQVDLRRMDQTNGQMQITYYLNTNDQSALLRMMDSLKQSYPESSVSLVEQNNLLGG